MKKSLVFLLLLIGAFSLSGQAAHAAVYTDSTTGLTWETTVQGPFTWEQALAHCETMDSGGQTDWRLPDINELQSLVRYDLYEPAAALSGIQSAFYWSSTTNFSSNGSAWGVNFKDGDVTTATKTDSFYVLAVRGGAYSLKCIPDPGNGDKTVTDPESGLIWEQATGGPMTWEEALAHCESLNLGGYTDWRLPDINELQSLVRYEEYDPAIDGSDCFQYGPFPDMVSDFFWSSTTNYSSNGAAWGVNFKDGDVTTATKTGTFHVRAVRGGTHQPRCIADNGNGDGTATDTESGLVWGQATIGPMTWQAALKHCEDLTLAGHDDWRLPDINELQSLVRYDSYDPAIRGSDCYKYGPYTDMVSDFFWSSTTNFSSNGAAWGVNFKDGDVTTQTKTGAFYVRPVRGGSSSGDLRITAPSGLSGTVPFTLELTAELSGGLADFFVWDINADGVPENSSWDNTYRITFEDAGTYPLEVYASDPDGNHYTTTVQITVHPSTTINEAIRFQPYYPESGVSSTVMKGGKTIRWYRILSEGTGEPVTDKKFYYVMRRNGTPIPGFQQSDIIDDEGFVSIQTPPVLSNGQYLLEVTDDSFNPIAVEVFDPPGFSVSVTPRSFSEFYGCLIGMGATVGVGGPAASLGPLEFETAKAGLEARANVSTKFIMENLGSRTDLNVINTAASEVGLKTFAGISGSIFKKHTKIKGTPELKAGIEANASISGAMATRHRFEDYSPDNDVQVIALAALFLENLNRLNPSMASNILCRKLLEYTIGKITDPDDYYDSFGFTAGVTTTGSLGAELSLTNPIGVSAGSSAGASVKAFDAEFMYERTDEKEVSGIERTKQAVIANLDIGSLKIGLEQKFGGDKRRKDTPKFKFDLFDGALLNLTGEQSLSFEKGPELSALRFETLTHREGDSFFFIGSKTIERYLELTGTSHQWTAMASILKDSDLARQMFFGDNFEIDSKQYIDAYQAFLNIRQGEVKWQEKEKKTDMISFSFSLGLSLGLSLDLDFEASVESGLEYTARKGSILPEKGMVITESYELDDVIQSDIKGFKAITEPYKRVLTEILREALETVEEIKAAADAVIVETKETISTGGAILKAGAGALGSGVILRISRFKSPVLRSYRIRAGIRSDTDLYDAATVGDVFIVSVEDTDGTLIETFSTPLELTIGYTEAGLTAAGYTLADADKLAIYWWDKDRKYYRYVGGTVQTAARSVTADITRAGQYILAIDISAPKVVDFRISGPASMPLITFSVQDDLSGLDLSLFRFAIDGTAAVSAGNHADYLDPATGAFRWMPDASISEGEHTITVTAGDTAGNTKTHTFPLIVDSTPPEITHTPQDSGIAGTPITIQAAASDNVAVKAVMLRYRPKTDELPYRLVQMTTSDGSNYTGTIPASDITSSGVRYSIKAMDDAGNTASIGPVDADIDDNTGPSINGNVSVHLTENGLQAVWPTPDDVDVAGYIVYTGASPDNLTQYDQIGVSPYIFLPESMRGSYIALVAYDDAGNEGPRTTTVKMDPCFTGDVNCDSHLNLDDALFVLKVLAGVSNLQTIPEIAAVGNTNKIGFPEALYILQKISGLR